MGREARKLANIKIGQLLRQSVIGANCAPVTRARKHGATEPTGAAKGKARLVNHTLVRGRTSLVVVITAQRLHSKVSDFGNPRRFFSHFARGSPLGLKGCRKVASEADQRPLTTSDLLLDRRQHQRSNHRKAEGHRDYGEGINRV